VKYPPLAAEAEIILVEAFISKRLRLSPCFNHGKLIRVLIVCQNATFKQKKA